MLCRKKCSPLRRKLRRSIAVLLAASVALITYYEIAVKAQLREVIIRDMQTVSEKAVNLAVQDFLSENFDVGEKLTDVAYSDGSVAAISTNPSYVNFVKTDITERAQAHIDDIAHHQGVSARLGSFTGLTFLMNVGPEIAFDVGSTQTVSCEFHSTFEGAGLNQTVHHITMTVYVDLLIYNPFRISETVSTESTFEIAQTVIVGAVPSYGGVLSY